MIDISEILFYDEYTGTGATGCPFLMGSVGDVITAKVTIKVHWEILQATVKFNTSDNSITLQSCPGPDGMYVQGSWIKAGFQVGDSFDVLTGPNAGTYTVSTITDHVMTTTGALVATGIETGRDFKANPAINGLSFFYNLDKNSNRPQFTSLTDFQTKQKYIAGTAGAAWAGGATKNLVNSTYSNGWETGSGTVLNSGVSNYIQTFVITHTFKITPYFLSDQKANLDDMVPPDYFADNECLRYVCQAKALTDVNDPNTPHVSNGTRSAIGSLGADTYFSAGNTGWFDEFLNGRTPDYTLTSIAYAENGTGTPMDRLDIAKKVDVTIVIHSDAGSFVNKTVTPGTPVVLNFAYAPLVETDYVNTPTTLEQNFFHDRKYVNLGDASANGDNYGTDYQVLTSIVPTYNSANQCTITFTVDLAAFLKTALEGKSDDNRNYIIWVTPQKKSITTLKSTDRNAVLCDFQNMDWNRDDATLLTWPSDVLFYQYPDTTTNGYTDFKGFIRDGVIARAKINVKQGMKLRDLTVNIRAYNSGTGSEFSLEQYSFDFEGKYAKDNYLPDAIDIIRDFKLASTDPRNQISFAPYVPNNNASYWGFQLNYGFKIRYEDWRKLLEFDKQFSQDPSEVWSQYSKASGWAVQMVITVNVIDTTQNDEPVTTFNRICPMTLKDQTDSSDGFGGTLITVIDTYIFNGGGYQNAHGFIASDQNTHVVATITGDFSGFPPGSSSYGGILSIDIETVGGYTFIDQSSTEESLIDGSIWATAAVLTVVNATTITIAADIDHTKLDPQVQRYLISARLIYKA